MCLLLGNIDGSMLFHRLRRWPNIDPSMRECILFAVLIIQLKFNVMTGYGQ